MGNNVVINPSNTGIAVAIFEHIEGRLYKYRREIVIGRLVGTTIPIPNNDQFIVIYTPPAFKITNFNHGDIDRAPSILDGKYRIANGFILSEGIYNIDYIDPNMEPGIEFGRMIPNVPIILFNKIISI